MASMHVELVSPEAFVWSGEAEMVIARTVEGEVGVLPGHAPLLGELAADAQVTIRVGAGSDIIASVQGGFLSVTADGVSILAETAELVTA